MKTKVFVILALSVCVGLVLALIWSGKEMLIMSERNQILEWEVEWLESRLLIYNRGEIPTITTYCREGEVEGPAGVPLEHPVLEISGQVSTPGLWLEVQVIDDLGGVNYILSVFGAATPNYTGVFDGYISSVRGNEGPHILNPDATYILRGFRYPYTTDLPDFQPDDLVFEERFTMPDCQSLDGPWSQEREWIFLAYEKIEGRWEFLRYLDLTEDEIPFTPPGGVQWCVINIEAIRRYGEERALELLCEVTMPLSSQE